MRQFIDILDQNADVTSKTEAFNELAQAQRGDPELAMVHAQHVIGGSILSGVIEHVGDLTHRMAQFPEHIPHSGFEMVLPKVKRCLLALNQPYGFEREMRENFESNAEYRGEDLRAYQHRVEVALARYAEEHSKLKVYNEAQRVARDAAVALGRLRFDDARRLLAELNAHLGSPEEWHAYAGVYDPS